MKAMDHSSTIARECIAMRIRLLSRVITKVYDDCLRPYGLRAAQMNILVAVSLLKPATPSEIERRLYLEKSTVSRNIDRMRQMGWLEFAPGTDGRSHQLKLTSQGAKLLSTAVIPWKQAQRQAESLLGKDGVKSLSRLEAALGAHRL